MAKKIPAAFDFDQCVTQMNLVTMYQTLIELKDDTSNNEQAIKYLKDTEARLAKYEEEQLPPSVKNMKGDIVYFKQVPEA